MRWLFKIIQTGNDEGVEKEVTYYLATLGTPVLKKSISASCCEEERAPG